LLTSTSIPPSSRTARSTTSWQVPGSVRSAATVTAVRPASRTQRAVSSASSFSASRYVTSTSAPSRANAIATARPMPESPPVITAFLPCNLPLPR